MGSDLIGIMVRGPVELRTNARIHEISEQRIGVWNDFVKQWRDHEENADILFPDSGLISFDEAFDIALDSMSLQGYESGGLIQDVC